MCLLILLERDVLVAHYHVAANSIDDVSPPYLFEILQAKHVLMHHSLNNDQMCSTTSSCLHSQSQGREFVLVGTVLGCLILQSKKDMEEKARGLGESFAYDSTDIAVARRQSSGAQHSRWTGLSSLFEGLFEGL
nr:hypothetical protein CFP56_03839 [Quercus suber]